MMILMAVLLLLISMSVWGKKKKLCSSSDRGIPRLGTEGEINPAIFCSGPTPLHPYHTDIMEEKWKKAEEKRQTLS